MGLRAKSLAPGEQVVLSVRTHWKALAGPVFLLLFVTALAGFATAVLPAGRRHHEGQLAIAAAAALLVLRLTVWPFLQWLSETFTITDRRLGHRAGVVRKTGRDLPLVRVADVSYDRSLWDRVFRCGTLIVQTAGEAGDIVFDDIPHVDEFEAALTEGCFGSSRRDLDDHAERASPVPPTGAAPPAVDARPAVERPEYARRGRRAEREERRARAARRAQAAQGQAAHAAQAAHGQAAQGPAGR